MMEASSFNFSYFDCYQFKPPEGFLHYISLSINPNIQIGDWFHVHSQAPVSKFDDKYELNIKACDHLLNR